MLGPEDGLDRLIECRLHRHFVSRDHDYALELGEVCTCRREVHRHHIEKGVLDRYRDQVSANDFRTFLVPEGQLLGDRSILIDNSFLYVVPVYLTAEGTDFPQLKRVILVSGNKVAMEPTLDEAIQSVFGTQQPQKPAQALGRQPELGHARAQFDEAQKAMQQGDWEKFGKAMDALKRLLTGPAQ